LPKYSFSPAKFRFQRLVSEKNNFLIIPNRVIRDALKYQKENKEIFTSTNVIKDKPVFDVYLGEAALMIYW